MLVGFPASFQMQDNIHSATECVKKKSTRACIYIHAKPRLLPKNKEEKEECIFLLHRQSI